MPCTFHSVQRRGRFGAEEALICPLTFAMARQTRTSIGQFSSLRKKFSTVSSAYPCEDTKSTGTWWTASYLRKSSTHAAAAVAGPPTRRRGLTAFKARAVCAYSSKYDPLRGMPPQKSIFGSFQTSKYHC